MAQLAARPGSTTTPSSASTSPAASIPVTPVVAVTVPTGDTNWRATNEGGRPHL